MTTPEQITQADRDAAADAVKAYRDNKNGDWQARIRNGECDDGYMVQAFARHRTIRTDATDVAALVEALDMAAFRLQLLVDRMPPDEDGKSTKANAQSFADKARQALAPFTKGQS